MQKSLSRQVASDVLLTGALGIVGSLIAVRGAVRWARAVGLLPPKSETFPD